MKNALIFTVLFHKLNKGHYICETLTNKNKKDGL